MSLHNSTVIENQMDYLFSWSKLEQRKLIPTIDQARKSARGMPWRQEPMKDVTSCDKLRGAANEH